MNAQQRKKRLAGRACACISEVHCCETLVQFRQRVPRAPAALPRIERPMEVITKP